MTVLSFLEIRHYHPLTSGFFHTFCTKLCGFILLMFSLPHVCLCNAFMPGAHGGERRALESLDLEL